MVSDLGRNLEKALRNIAQNGIRLPVAPKSPWSPEEAFLKVKAQKFLHPSNYDGYELLLLPSGTHCNDISGCIPSCPYYPETGRIDP